MASNEAGRAGDDGRDENGAGEPDGRMSSWWRGAAGGTHFMTAWRGSWGRGARVRVDGGQWNGDRVDGLTQTPDAANEAPWRPEVAGGSGHSEMKPVRARDMLAGRFLKRGVGLGRGESFR